MKRKRFFQNLIFVFFLCVGTILGTADSAWAALGYDAGLMTENDHDPSFEGAVEKWTYTTTGATYGSTTDPASDGSKTFRRINTTTTYPGRTLTTDNFITGVTGGSEYRLEVGWYHSGSQYATSLLEINIQWYDNTPTLLSTSTAADLTVIQSTWELETLTANAHADATQAKVLIRWRRTTGTTSGRQQSVDRIALVATAVQVVTVQNVNDATNTITTLDGTEWLQDYDSTVSFTTAVDPDPDTPHLYYDTFAPPTTDRGAASGSHPNWTQTISAAHIADGDTVYFRIKIGAIYYYRTGTTSWSYKVDGAAPTGAGCSSPADLATGISIAVPLVATAASDGTGSGGVKYYFLLSTDSGFSGGLQNSGWQSSTTWGPSTHLTQNDEYWWKVKARDAVQNESAYGATRKFTTADTKNFLYNEYFANWPGDGVAEAPTNWVYSGTQSRCNRSDDYVVSPYSTKIDCTTLTEKQFYQYVKTMVNGKTYYAEVWCKGQGKFRIGIKDGAASPDYGSYQIWKTTEDPKDWTKVTHQFTATTTGTNGGLVLSECYSPGLPDEVENTADLFIGAAWVSDVASPSNWPTLIGLVDFQALAYEREVWLWWETGSEVGNAGFNIYRSENRDGPYTRLNESLIPGLLYSVTGRVYWYLDNDVFDGTTYYYKLEDVDCFGKKTQHGPVWATPGIDSDDDGIPDGWEERYGLDPYLNDGGLDPDNDGLTNYEEFLNDTDPFNPDTDGDGILDGDEENIPPCPPEPEPIIKKEGIEIIESDESGITLELTTEEFNEEEKIEEGITYQRISIPGYIHGHSSEIGKPQVPLKGVLLGVPSDSSIEISILDTESTILSGYNLYPVPTQEAEESGNVKYVKEVFTKDEAAYNSDALYPDNLAEQGFTGYKRDQKVVQIKLYPIQFNPVTKELKFYKKIRVRLDFSEVDQFTVSPVHRFTDSLVRSSLKALPAFSGPTYKLALNYNYEENGLYQGVQEGIYKLDYQYLLNNASDIASQNPKTFKIYNSEGNEVAIYVSGEDDGSFSSGDYIEFYGKIEPTKYASTNVYWLTSGGLEGLRMNEKENTGSSDTPVSTFFSLKEKEDDLRYFGRIPGEDSFDRWFFYDYPAVTYGHPFRDYTLTLKDVAPPEGNARIRVTLRGYWDIPPENNNHAKVYVNDHQVGEAYWDGREETTLDTYFLHSYLNSGAGSQDQTIRVESLLDTGAGYDMVLIDSIKINYRRNFVADNNDLRFSENKGDHLFQISGFTTGDIKILDITDENNPQRITFTVEGSYTAKFNDNISGTTTYLAQAPLTPTIEDPFIPIEKYEDSGIHSPDNGADYIIITPDDFYDDSNLDSLVNHREAKGLRVKKVKVSDIYDEFNHGIFSPQAIKDFLTYAYDNWQSPRPKYCLLVGDASYDYKNNKGNELFTHLPTYPSYTTFFGETANDNWYTWISGDDYIPDIYIGRLPVRTTTELGDIVDKIRTYEETPSTNTWENNILLVADDDEYIFEDINNGLATGLCQATPVYLAQPPYNGDASACKDDIIEAIDNGVAIVNYVGHANTRQWAAPLILHLSDIPSLVNEDRLPFFVVMTCYNNYFSNIPNIIFPDPDCLGEKLLKAQNKGAIGVFSSTGATDPPGQRILDEGLFQAFFGGTTHILGDAIAQAYTTFIANSSGYEDIPKTFSLLGDPALELKIPFAPGAGIDHHRSWYECPIATAAYGTSLAEEVEVFRNFRDERLLTNRKGRALVRFYYKHSPPVARFIERKKALKTLMRRGLKPILWLAKKATKPPHKYPIWE